MRGSGHPVWLESDRRSGNSGMWPLGLEPVGFRLGGRLLPALNNATRDIRYYSFFCWVFWTFDQQVQRGDQPLTVGAQKDWRGRVEMAFRLATLYKDPDVLGLVGVTRVARPSGDPEEMLSLDPGDVTTAFQPAFYSSSFTNFGCGLRLPNHLIQLTAEIGVPLARAFNEQIRRERRSTEALSWLLSDSVEVPAWTIQTLAEGLCLRSIAPGEPEHRVLLDLLFRLRPAEDIAATEIDAARSRSLGLLLDVALQADGSLTMPHQLHRVFATGQLPNGNLLRLHPAFVEDWAGWQRYQERQYQKVAIYGLWSVIVELLGSGISLPDAMGDRIVTAVREAELAMMWLGTGGFDSTVRSAQERLRDHASAEFASMGAALDDLAERVVDRHTDWRGRAAAACLLLLLVTEDWRVKQDQLSERQCRVHKYAGRERLALHVVTKDVDQRSARTLEELLRWALGSYVLAQANRTALAKLVNQKQYQFFIAQDAAGYRLVKKVSPRDYLHYDNPHIANAYELMQGIGLIEWGDNIQVTEHGEAMLRAIQEHHDQLRNGSVLRQVA